MWLWIVFGILTFIWLWISHEILVYLEKYHEREYRRYNPEKAHRILFFTLFIYLLPFLIDILTGHMKLDKVMARLVRINRWIMILQILVLVAIFIF